MNFTITNCDSFFVLVESPNNNNKLQILTAGTNCK
jgi:hypothetical protein